MFSMQTLKLGLDILVLAPSYHTPTKLVKTTKDQTPKTKIHSLKSMHRTPT